MIDELLKAWGSSDWSDIARSLGYPSTSPSFKMLGEPEAALDPFELGHEEVRAMSEAVQWLADEHPDIFAGVARTYRPWVYGRPLEGDKARVASATNLLVIRLRLSAL